MADEPGLEDFCGESVTGEVVLLQAVVRGQIVRSQMKEIRKLYMEIVHEIDGPGVEVVWSCDLLSRPVVRKLKKGTKMENIDLTKDMLNLADSQTTRHFDSARPERDSGPAVSPACVNAQLNVVELQMERCDVVSAEVQTDDDKVHLGCVSFLNKEHQNKQIQEFEMIGYSELGQQTTKMTACSEVQADNTSSFSHRNSPASDGSSQVSNSGEVRQDRQFRNYSSSGKTDASLQRASSAGSGMPASEELVVETFQSGGSSEKLVYESGKYNMYSEKFVEDDVCLKGKGSETLGNRTSENGVEKLWNRASENGVSLEKLDADIFDGEMDVANEGSENSRGCLAGVSGPGEMMPLPDDQDQLLKMIPLPDDQDQLLKMKDTVALELLWVLQAINSRKHYLRLKEQMQ